MARGILFLSSFLLIPFNFGEDLVHPLHLALFRDQILLPSHRFEMDFKKLVEFKIKKKKLKTEKRGSKV